MATLIETTLDEASGVALRFLLKDSEGATVSAGSISAISYTWTEANGAEINGKTDESVAAANPVDIKLDEVDTAIVGYTREVTRLLTITWVYNDTVLGLDTQKVKEFEVPITNHRNK